MVFATRHVHEGTPTIRPCCQRSVIGPKITRAPYRRRIGGAVPREEKFGDLITADHKVLNEKCEPRNNHRYAVVVQDLATQWIQSYPCKNKNFRKLREAWQSSWSPIGSLKFIYTDNPLEFGKACDDHSWNHCTSTPHRSETKKTTLQMTRFRDVKVCNNYLVTDEIDDHRIQSDYKTGIL